MSAPAAPNAFRNATLVGTVLQLTMVLSGHWIEFVKANVFAFGGMGLAFVTGVVYARLGRQPRSASASGGALTGAISALIAIVVSIVLGDTQPMILAIGGVSSAVTGAIGGALAGGTK